LRPAARVGGRRRYEHAAVYQLRLIRFCQQLGFSLAEIRELVTPPNGQTAKDRWRRLVDDKLGELETAITQAREMTRLLKESRDCDCVKLDSCHFVRDSG
jgi:MerR family transcriptional regulator, redox-sensitive transcriptional activator SoxR